MALTMQKMMERTNTRRLNTLIRAIEAEDRDTIHRALTKGVDLNQLDKKGLTPLMYAAKTQNLDIIGMLLGAGANPQGRMRPIPWGEDAGMRRDVEGSTALHFVYNSNWFGGGPTTVEPMKQLLDAGGDPNDCNHLGESLLYQYIRHALCYSRRLYEAQQAGRDTSGPTLWRQTCVQIVELLLAAGADSNLGGRGGVTPLMLTGRSTLLTKMLLDAGADVHLRDEEGQTALSCAEHPEVIRMLQEAGAVGT
jgi:hypothetical protein